MDGLDLTTLRQKMIKQRAGFTPEKRTHANQSIQKQVIQMWRGEWKAVLIYVNRAEEVSTVP